MKGKKDWPNCVKIILSERQKKQTRTDKRLEKLKKYNAKQRAVETDEDRHKRLQKRRDNDAKRRAEETILGKQA